MTAGESSSEASQQALEELCRRYWRPLYAYVRRLGHKPHDAEDLTQDFFARLLAKKYLRLADRERGRFRTFLLTSLKHFLRNDWRDQRTARRGGGIEIKSLEEDADNDRSAESANDTAPELIFDRQWATTLIDRILTELSAEYSSPVEQALFSKLRPFLVAAEAPPSYEALAGELNTTPGAVRTAVHRLRERYRELLRAEVANTVACPADVDDELRHLASVIRAQ